MKIKLTMGGKVYIARRPFPECEYVEVPGEAPHCDGITLQVKGDGDVVTGYDTYTVDALCARCKEPVGILVTTVKTLFGIEEDRRVLNGRCRVY